MPVLFAENILCTVIMHASLVCTCACMQTWRGTNSSACAAVVHQAGAHGLMWQPHLFTGDRFLQHTNLFFVVGMFQVDMLYGRKIQAVPEQVRWIESFTVST
jgi:hypothetical protein